MRRLLFLFLLCPAAASATSVHYDFDPGAYFYVHLWDGAPNGPTRFDVDCTGGFLAADDVLGFAHLFATYDGGAFDVSVSTPFGVGGITFDDSGDLTHVGPRLAGTLDYQGETIAIDQLGSFVGPGALQTIAPGLIHGDSEWAGWLGNDLIEWGIDFTAQRRDSQPAAVPEPGTLLMLGAGVLGLGRKRRNALALSLSDGRTVHP